VWVTGVERWTSAPMAHSGAPPRLLLRREEEERGGEAGDRMEWRVCGRGAASRPGGGVVGLLKITFTLSSQKQSCSKTKTLQLCFNKQDQIPNRI